MQGGLQIETEEEAERFGRREIADMDLAVGDVVTLEPCVRVDPQWPDARYDSEERPCPYVPLQPENEVAAGLATALITPRLQPAFGKLFDANYPPGHPEAAAVMQRVVRAASSDAVAESERRAAVRRRQAADNAATRARAQRGDRG
jgi:hypothetical protein